MRKLRVLLCGMMLAGCSLAANDATPAPNTPVPSPTRAPATDTPAVTATTTSTAAPEPACAVRADWMLEYTVQPGDTLTRIAQLNGLSADEIAAGNCLENPNRLDRGDVLRLPAISEGTVATPLPDFTGPGPLDPLDPNAMPVFFISESAIPGTTEVACDSYLVPANSSDDVTSDTATNIQTSLEALFDTPQTTPDGYTNYWGEMGLSLDAISLSAGRLDVDIRGRVTLLGACADGAMEAQLLRALFNNGDVQSARVTANGQNVKALFDMSGQSGADATYTRDEAP